MPACKDNTHPVEVAIRHLHAALILKQLSQAPQAGEIVSFSVEEGQPVEYNQPILELAPFFGGHIIGDRKHA